MVKGADTHASRAVSLARDSTSKNKAEAAAKAMTDNSKLCLRDFVQGLGTPIKELTGLASGKVDPG
eukprot:163794-Alexandrium_andersonii.AAC.1